MAKYLLLKHYRGNPAPVVPCEPMDRWTPAEVDAHIQYMRDFATKLEGTGEYVDAQALSPEGTFVRYDGEGRPPVTDGPFAETKDLIAGYWLWQVRSVAEAVEWIRRSPFRKGEAEVEIRRVFEAEDFGPSVTAELRDQEASLRARAATKN